MKPDDFAGYRPHQIRRLLRRGRRPVALRAREKDAPGEGPKRTQETSLFPGGNVRLLTSAPDWAFTGPNQLPTYPGPTERPGSLGGRSLSAVAGFSSDMNPLFSSGVLTPEAIGEGVSPNLSQNELHALLPTGEPGTPELNIENTKEIVAPEPDKQLALEPIQTLQLEGDDINDEMNENSSLTEPLKTPASPEIEDYQEPEIELPLPVIVALQEREARRQNSEEEFPGADVRSSKSRNKQEVAFQTRQEEDISLSHHAARCSICQHPDRDAIEQGYLHWESPTLLAYEYGLGQRRAVYRHARALGLREKRGARTRRSLEFVIEQGENVTATADSLIRAVRAYSCLSEDGRWTEPTKRVIITHEHIDVVREADSGPSLATRQSSPARRGGLATASVTLGDGHAVPSKNAVTPAPPTKAAKLMDTLFKRFAG